MTKNLYFCEVGVLLDSDNPDFEWYSIETMPKEFGYYDEDITTFLTKEESYDYAKKYVESGVEKTYAICYDFLCKHLTKKEIDEIKNYSYCENLIEPPTLETTTLFIYKENGEIKEYKLWKIER